MRTRAAVAVAAGKPLEIMEVNLDDPKAGEVLIEIKATGICHTDEFTLSGADPEGIFPSILGHEGAGVVVKCGPGVTTRRCRSRSSDRLTNAKTSKVASDVLAASRSNGTSSASATVAAAIRTVARIGVAVLPCTRPSARGKSPWRDMP